MPPAIPREPRMENMRFKGNVFQKVFMSKAAKKQKIEEQFEIHQQKYEDKKVKYKTSYQIYEDALAAYPGKLEQHEHDLEQWYNELNDRLQMTKNYIEEYAAFQSALRLKSTLKRYIRMLEENRRINTKIFIPYTIKPV